MSREAIAAALARTDLAGGERLVAFALASYAGRDGRAWPGAPAAAARAGLSRSRYLHDRDRLVRRGLVDVEEQASGRGRSSTVALRFAAKGPWWEGEINAELFESVLSRTRLRGPARLVIAAMAALADVDGTVRGVSNEELCIAAGVEDRTYRRARPELLRSGELLLLRGARGRGHTNVWQVRVPDEAGTCGSPPASSARRVAPSRSARPLVVTIPRDDGAGKRDDILVKLDPGDGVPGAGDGKGPVSSGYSVGKGGQNATVSHQNRPVWSVVSTRKGGQDRTLFKLLTPENPAQNPAENPAANARAGTEPQKPRTGDPPCPPEGGSEPRSTFVEQSHVTERGRRRRRLVRVDLDAVRRGLGRSTEADRADWSRIRELLRAAVGESTFEIWLAPVELLAVDGDRRLVLAAPAATASWTVTRFERLLARCAQQVGRELRFGTEPEIHALGDAERRVQQPGQEAAG